MELREVASIVIFAAAFAVRLLWHKNQSGVYAGFVWLGVSTSVFVVTQLRGYNTGTPLTWIVLSTFVGVLLPDLWESLRKFTAGRGRAISRFFQRPAVAPVFVLVLLAKFWPEVLLQMWIVIAPIVGICAFLYMALRRMGKSLKFW